MPARQGYLFARPLDPGQLRAYLQESVGVLTGPGPGSAHDAPGPGSPTGLPLTCPP